MTFSVHRPARRRLTVAAAAGTAVLAAACTSSPAAPPTAPAPPAYAVALQPQLEQQARDLLVTGAVVQVRSPEKGDWTTTIGTKAYRGTQPVEVADHIRVGSVTKSMTGTVVLQLVDEGKIRLDDPVAKYRPDVPNGQNITVEQMLSMRSGLGNYTTDLGVNERMDADQGAVFQPEDMIKIGLAKDPEFRPGEGFFYSNTNTLLLGRIVEQLTGNPLATEFQRRIFAPLDMRETSFPAITDAGLPDPHPQGYTYGTNVETIPSNVLSPERQAAARAGTLAPMDVTMQNPSWGWSAGAAISTSDDLLRYVKALVGGGLLSPELQKVRLDSVRPVDPATPDGPGYGLAMARFGPFYGHTGELPGFNTFTGYDPKTDTTVVVWTSLAPSPDGQDPAAQMARTIIGRLTGDGS